MGDIPDETAQPRSSGRLLTVGIPVFNGKALLRSCLQSVINSTLPRDRFEIVVADDGSSEPETLAILGEFEQSLAVDPGFFCVISSRTNSGGAARPRNQILDVATGEYVFFLDSDDSIGDQALERVAEAVARTPADWVAVNQVPVNGRGALVAVGQPRAEVTRARALLTLTVHKVFRRAEIERQRLRFDEKLPSGQDVSFAFAYILNAASFLMLGGYDYYYLTEHADDPDEPVHLSRRANTPKARIKKNERILRSMLTALGTSTLPEPEKQTILGQVTLPRLLLQEGYLEAIVKAGPTRGKRALRRLAELCTDPLVAGLDAAGLTGVTGEQLAAIGNLDWTGLTRLVRRASPQPPGLDGFAARWVRRGRRVVDLAPSPARYRRSVAGLAQRPPSQRRRPVAVAQGAPPPPQADLLAELPPQSMMGANELDGPTSPEDPPDHS